MSMREYAKHAGVTLATLQRRIKRGAITERAFVNTGGAHPKIDSEVADFEWDCHRTPEQTAFKEERPAQRVAPPAPVASDLTKNCQEVVTKLQVVPQTIDNIHQIDEQKAKELVAKVSENRPESVTPEPERKEDTPADTDKPPLEDKFGRYRDAKTTTEEYRARKLELEVAEAEGRVIDADEVRKRISKLVGESREALLNIPGKIAPTLISITDIVEMENKLRDEINAALESLSRLKNGNG